MMLQPKFADDDEADQSAWKLWPKIDKLMTQLGHAAAFMQNRGSKSENGQP